MFILDKPYASKFLIETIVGNSYSVLKNNFTEELAESFNGCLLAEKDFKFLSQIEDPKIYTSSENSIGWIEKHLPTTNLPKNISLFKDKVKFRKLTANLYPELFFQSIAYSKIDRLDINKLPLPFVIKPAVGFFSMGVHIVHKKEEWSVVKSKIADELLLVKDLYPKEVMNTENFIIEELIEGEEFAFDAYYNENGEPVLLGMFKHHFASEDDVSDRVYYTSKQIVSDNSKHFYNFLKNISNLTELKNFPLHIEMRKTPEGNYIPIEVNPMRFGGWCTTADASYHAFGFNAYKCFIDSIKPKWEEILSRMDDSLYSLIVLDNSSGIDASNIGSFNYNLLQSSFENVLEVRKVNYSEYPVFGFLMTKTSSNNFQELDRIAKSNLSEYIISKH